MVFLPTGQILSSHVPQSLLMCCLGVPHFCLLWQKSCWHNWKLNSYSDYKFNFKISKIISLTLLKNKGPKCVCKFSHFHGVMSAGNISVLFSKKKSKGHRPTKRQGMDTVGNWQIHPIKEIKVLTTIPSLIYLILPKSPFPNTITL